MKTQRIEISIGQLIAIGRENKARTDNKGALNFGNDQQRAELALSMSLGYDNSRDAIKVRAASVEDWTTGRAEAKATITDKPVMVAIDEDKRTGISRELQEKAFSLCYPETPPITAYKVVCGFRRIDAWVLAQAIRLYQNETIETTLEVVLCDGSEQELLALNIEENERRGIGALETSWPEKIANGLTLYRSGLIQKDLRAIYGHGTGQKIWSACQILDKLPPEMVSALDLSKAKQWDKEQLRAFAQELDTLEEDEKFAADKATLAPLRAAKQDKIKAYLAGNDPDKVTGEELKAAIDGAHKYVGEIVALYKARNCAGLTGWAPAAAEPAAAEPAAAEPAAAEPAAAEPKPKKAKK